jgi:hypothetical protein
MLICLFFSVGIAFSSDHIDGEITIDDAPADITDLFVFISPSKPGNLVMVMNTYPFAGGDAHFSDRLSYNFNVRRLSSTGNGVDSGFDFHESYDFECRFYIADDEHDPSKINCNTPGGVSVKALVDEVQAVDGDLPIKVFAGQRSDPFMFNPGWFTEIALHGRIPPQQSNSNQSSGLNTLSIILEIDTQQVFDLSKGSLFAVAAETIALDDKGNQIKRIDRVGRPEISNASLARTDRQNDLRNSYNAEVNFDVSAENFVQYQQRLADNVDYYDALDGVVDWQPEWRTSLINFILNDFISIDISKPYANGGYFELENAMLRSQPITRGGGRSPDQDILSSIFSILVNGGHGPEINSGIEPGEGMQMTFPYLNEPNTGIIAWFKRVFGRPISEKTSFEVRR